MNQEVKSWDQPILNQLHGGILAIISKITQKGVQFLLRIRIEPGDDGKLKYCPTFQATISNINKAHGGKRPLFYKEVFNNKNTKTIFLQVIMKRVEDFGKKLIKILFYLQMKNLNWRRKPKIVTG